jgi:uncharacterized protein DUF2860
MLSKCMQTVVLLLVLLIDSSVVYAFDNIDRFDGTIGLGVIYLNSGNNLNPNGSKEIISGLNSAADKESTILPMILPEITYDIGKPEGLNMYFATRPPIDEAGSFAFNLGGSYPLAGKGILDASVFFSPFEKVWENPYLTGAPREESSTSKYGAKLAFNKIMGTGLRVNAVIMNDDVDDDVIGLLHPSMARDGAIYALNANYSFYVSETFEIRPRISLRKGEYDGEVNSFTKYKFDLEARFRAGQMMIVPRFFYSHSEYDEINPIFGQTREDDGYGFNLMATYMAPFGWKSWSVVGLLSLSQGDSNIDFYDTEGITFGTFLSYHF